MELVGRTKQGRVFLRVYIQPRASINRVCGIHGDALKLALKAPPVDGKANKSAASYIAELFGVSTKSVLLSSGKQSRKKTFTFTTLNEEELRVQVESLLSSMKA